MISYTFVKANKLCKQNEKGEQVSKENVQQNNQVTEDMVVSKPTKEDEKDEEIRDIAFSNMQIKPEKNITSLPPSGNDDELRLLTMYHERSADFVVFKKDVSELVAQVNEAIVEVAFINYIMEPQISFTKNFDCSKTY